MLCVFQVQGQLQLYPKVGLIMQDNFNLTLVSDLSITCSQFPLLDFPLFYFPDT